MISLKKTIIFLLIIIPLSWNNAICQQVSKEIDLNRLIKQVDKENVFSDPDYFNWGSSIIKGIDNKYHLFYSRWPRELGFGAWLTHSEIAHAVSDFPAGPYHYIETVLKSRGGTAWDAITVHNPKIKFFEGKYYLYYISTNLGETILSPPELLDLIDKDLSNVRRNVIRRNQRTGVAVSSSINGPWERMNKPIIEPSGPITTLTVNPAITQGPDGRYFLIVKGDKPNETRFIRNQAMAIGNSPTGPFEMQPKPVIGDLDTEDVSLWYSKTDQLFYAVFHAHTHIGLICSADGINWEKATNYLVTEKKIEFKDNSFLEPDRMERPFVYLANDVPTVLCLSIMKGDDSYIVLVPLDK